MSDDDTPKLIQRIKPIIPVKNNIITFPGGVQPPPTNSTPRRGVGPKGPKKDQDPQPEPLNVDKELLSMLDLPVPLPTLRKEAKKMEKEEDLLSKDIQLLEKYRKKPLLFWRDELGIPIDVWRDDMPPKDWRPGDPVPLWSKQREIIKDLVIHKKIAIKSGHGIGKSFLVAGIVLYLTYVWHATGVTTAPTFRQVRRILWGEIHHMWNKARNPLGGRLNQVSLDLDDKWFVEGFATDKPESNIAGIHEENIFVVVDEAGGAHPDLFDVLDTILTSENSFVILIGNPIVAEGGFFEAFKPGSGFKTHTISCYECPNVKHDRVIYSKLTVKKWVTEREKKWGKGSNLFLSRVEGEFPDESSDILISLKYLEAALQKGTEEGGVRDKIKSIGVDVARQGSDSTVVGIRWDSGFFEIKDTMNKKRETEVAGRVKFLYDQWLPEFKYRKLKEITPTLKRKLEGDDSENESPPFPPINIDDIGAGGGVVDILVEDEYPANQIVVSEAPDAKADPELGIFLNKRAQYYWKLKLEFEAGRVSVDDEELIFELSKMKVEFLRSGKIKIIDKEIIKKELNGRSPDRAESMMLAYSEEGSTLERDMLRFL
jgi:phage terminase large subunit